MFVCGIASAAVAILMIFLVIRMAVDVPFGDDWSWTAIIVGLHNGTLTLADLWRPHLQHRMFFPELIVLALDRLSGWSQVNECLASVVLVIVGQLIVLQLLRRTFAPQLAWPLWFIESLLLLSPSQSQNWVWGFQIAWFSSIR